LSTFPFQPTLSEYSPALSLPDSYSGDSASRFWYALRIHSQREKFVSSQLTWRGVSHFLPLYAVIHRWSDRQKKVELPLFPGYLFVNIADSNESKLSVLSTPGVAHFVGIKDQPSTISEAEIEAVRKVTSGETAWQEHPYLEAGTRVRIHGGALDGTEGIFQRHKGKHKLVISIQALQRSLAVVVDENYEIEVLGR